MRVIATLLAIVIVSFLPLPRSAASPTTQPVPPLANNAALQYLKGFVSLPTLPAEVDLIESWRTAPMNAATVRLVGPSIALEFLHAGSAMSACDWGLDYSQGILLRLPYVNGARLLTELGCLRIQYDFSKQRPSAAVDDAGDVLRMARYCGADGLLICRLVQFGFEREVVDALAMNLDKLEAADLANLQQRLASLPDSDSISIAVDLERYSTVDVTLSRIQASGVQALDNLLMVDPGHAVSKDIVTACGGTQEGVVDQLQKFGGFYGETKELLEQNLPPAEFNTKFQIIRDRYQSNPFAKALLPSLDRAYGSYAQATTRLALLNAAIVVLQHGPDSVVGMTDPINHEAITYRPQGKGFVLSSTVLQGNGKPLELPVGQTE